MARITNERSGASALAVELNILRKEPHRGQIMRGNVMMNADLNLVWIEVKYWAGNQAFFSHEVLVHSNDIFTFCWEVKEKMRNEQQPGEVDVWFGFTSPELNIRLTQNNIDRATIPASLLPDSSDDLPQIFTAYELLIFIDIGIANGEEGPMTEGPAMYLEPDDESLVAFLDAFEAETNAVISKKRWFS